VTSRSQSRPFEDSRLRRLTAIALALPEATRELRGAHAQFSDPKESRGRVALRLDRDKVDWDEANELLLSSYMLVAPKRLAMI
jgi:hypothetical protein